MDLSGPRVKITAISLKLSESVRASRVEKPGNARMSLPTISFAPHPGLRVILGPMPLMHWFGLSAIRDTGTMRPVGKLWSRLPTRYRWVVLLCLSTLIVLATRLLLPFSSRLPIDGAILAACYPKLLTWLFRNIGAQRMKSARTGLRWAFYPFVVGLALIPVGLFVFPWSAQIGTGLGGAGFLILLLGSCRAFVIIDSIVGASSIFGRAAVFISITFLAASILLFPNVIVFLMSNGQWPRPILGGPASPSRGLTNCPWSHL